ncbi:membrane-bound serine protease (ClpP class) [Symbiobacterium terraclitae]|uniref:Membrane-bound serine protease (ClpP class) n=1 Tax=Symbiobacterium terraclitae TaxID=557451 RepID=A0ABS4JR23_9FIRM|nr:NfeD family protein [Symbiobacterium terraclitae]MBP2017341.1 membrane-bound serine protease (ClpP class) [Symbiobacterium terraclitae]
MRQRLARLPVAALLLALFLALAAAPAALAADGGQKVYVLRIDQGQVIDVGLAQFADRVFDEAEADPAAVGIAVVLDTPGGYVDAAARIKDRLLASRKKTIAYVANDAISAGALIATAAEYLYMHPGSVIGAAEPRTVATNQTADYKALSVVVNYFTSAAEARRRDVAIARAFVDKDHPIPGQTDVLLTLTYQHAVETGYANGVAESLNDAIRKAGIDQFELVEPQWTFSEQVGRVLTTPWVAILLLVAGVIALGIEFTQPGLTGPAAVGIVCLSLFFIGNALVGTAGWVEIALAVSGLVLLLVELFTPGFGIFGLSGIAAFGAAIFLAAPSPELAGRYLMWTAIASAVVLFAAIRAISRRGLGRMLTLSEAAKDWSAQSPDRSRLVGQEGRTVTVLRPAGTAVFGDQRLDVVTEGEFVPAGVPVRVIRVDGTRIVVRSIE